MNGKYNINLAFLKSTLSVSDANQETNKVIDWLKKQNESVQVNINRIRFTELEQWYADQKNASLRHESGGFFSIDVPYEIKIFTTIPRQKVPTKEEDLKEISKKLFLKDWNEDTNPKSGYTHRTNLKDYPGLIFLRKEQ